jgi:tetratricopeptide (TPR) repeat protein
MNLRWRLSHISGYLALGMVREAERELKTVRPEQADLLEVRAAEVAILHAKQNWRRLRSVAGALARRQPERVEWWVTHAYATRRAVSIEKARAILLEAENHHPAEAVVQFNLGCYASLLGELEEARRRVERAVALDPQFKVAADEDPDLEALRRAGGRRRS